ncbi:MAG: hypothetical protein OXF66_02110 [Gammaproteobacteria bacterium]|nr:hypothetical protein [Gammaproteobacteria bacterium]
MTDTKPNPHELELKLAVLEEKMKTAQSEYKTDIARLAEDNAKRETRLILALVSVVVLAIAILRFTD